MRLILILTLAFLPSFAFSTSPAKDSISINTNLIKEIDSLKIIVSRLSREQSQPYQEILEKTNQQLSLWTNPYALMISSLAILFTLLTIIAAIIIYSQGKEYRERIDSFLLGYKDLLEKLVSDWKTRLAEIDKRSTDYQKQLESATGQQKKLIETELNKLKSERESVKSQIASSVVVTPGTGRLLSFDTSHLHKCTKCGKEFLVQSSGSSIMRLLAPETAKCPFCGNVDQLS